MIIEREPSSVSESQQERRGSGDPGGGFGETDVEFGKKGEIKITERKSGEETHHRIEKKPKTAFEQLGENERKRTKQEVQELGKRGEFAHLSPSRQNYEISKRREEIARRILEEREEVKPYGE